MGADVKPTVQEALAAVMRSVGHVAKSQTNQQQRWNFRGIDDVMNACGPALREHGVIALPKVLNIDYGTQPTRNGAVMQVCRLLLQVEWIGPAGDSLITVVAGESFDSGDKATAKAHSVALRTAYIQTLCLPTDERDPDQDIYESAAPVGYSEEQILTKIQQAKVFDELKALYEQCKNSPGYTPQVNQLFNARRDELS